VEYFPKNTKECIYGEIKDFFVKKSTKYVHLINLESLDGRRKLKLD